MLTNRLCGACDFIRDQAESGKGEAYMARLDMEMTKDLTWRAQ